jgi:hypothetical protein
MIWITTDALITILSGDFNLNVKKRDKQSDSLLKLVQYHGFLPTHNNVTHRAGGALDRKAKLFEIQTILKSLEARKAKGLNRNSQNN